MKSEKQKGDSESDWDSMSEMQQCPTSESAKSKFDANTSYGVSSREEEIPPYSFKHDGENPSNQVPSERPPGKTKKGCLYDPSSQEEQRGNPPRKLKPLPAAHLNEMEKRNMKQSLDFGPKNHSERPTNSSEASHSESLKGLRNSGFIRDDYDKNTSDIDEEEEEEQVSEECEERERKNSGQWKRNFGVMRHKRFFKNSNKNCNREANFISSPSIRKGTSESPFKETLKLIDSLIEKAFHTFAFPFACFFLLLHHCIKHDGENPSNQVPSERPPGKTKKGCLYDPSSQEEQRGNPPRKLKPLPAAHLNEMEKRNMKQSLDFGPKNHSERPTNSSEASHSESLKGLRNSGFIRDDYDKNTSDIDEEEDEEQVSEECEERERKNSGQWKRNFGVMRHKRFFKNSNKNCNREANFISSPSIRKGTSESPFKETLKLIDSLIEKAFHTFAFPFACFFLLLHHCIKFLLVGIVHPLLIESLSLFSKYFFEPFSNKVLKPILRTLFLVVETLSAILAKVLFPLTEVLRSFRLVEINVNKKQDTLCV